MDEVDRLFAAIDRLHVAMAEMDKAVVQASLVLKDLHETLEQKDEE